MSATWSSASLCRIEAGHVSVLARLGITPMNAGGIGVLDSAPVEPGTVPPMPPASPSVEQVADAIHTELRRDPWTFTLVHGDIESPADARALEELNQVALLSHCLLMSQGHNDTTSWVFDEDGGRAACMAMHAIACTAGRFWWRCQTRFGGPR